MIEIGIFENKTTGVFFITLVAIYGFFLLILQDRIDKEKYFDKEQINRCLEIMKYCWLLAFSLKFELFNG